MLLFIIPEEGILQTGNISKFSFLQDKLAVFKNEEPILTQKMLRRFSIWQHKNANESLFPTDIIFFTHLHHRMCH